MSITAVAPRDLDDIADLHDDEPGVTTLLERKPSSDPVPRLVWWLTAHSLRSSVLANEALACGATATSRLGEAELYADVALDELRDAVGTGGVDLAPVMAPSSVLAATADMRRSAVPVARLLMSRRSASPTAVAAALARHRRAIARCRRALLTATSPA